MPDTDILDRLFAVAVAAADPAVCVPRHLPAVPEGGRTVVLAAGKAAAGMARAVETSWNGPVSGLAITRYGHGVACDRIDVVEAAHPVPDEAGLQAAKRLLAKAAGLGPHDLALCLISGGGSALLTVPAPGLTLADKQAVNRALLACGATISEINCIRKHLSTIKGGRLAAAAMPARVVTLIISDVPGDDPATVASGPTVPDPTTREDALAIIRKYRLDVPPAVIAHLEAPASESPKPGDPAFARSEAQVIAASAQSLAAAAAEAEAAGLQVLDLGDRVEGEAREVAADHAALALDIAAGRGPVRPPVVILSGGVTTVTVRGKGRGGRNAEYALALAIALGGHPRIRALACDTDGIDGSGDNAGARIHPDTLAKAAALGLDPQQALDGNDAYGLFSAIGDLVMTGPTGTNVNDFRAILVD